MPSPKTVLASLRIMKQFGKDETYPSIVNVNVLLMDALEITKFFAITVSSVATVFGISFDI